MIIQPPPGGPLSDDEAREMAALLARFAAHELDQFENWRIETPQGPVFATLANELMPGLSSETFVTIWPLPHRLQR